MSSLDILPESWFTKSCLKTQPTKALPSRSESRSVSEHLGDGGTIQVKHRKEASLMPLEKTMVVNRRHLAKRPESKWRRLHLVPTRQIKPWTDELVSRWWAKRCYSICPGFGSSSYGSTRLLFSHFLHSGSTTSTEQKVS